MSMTLKRIQDGLVGNEKVKIIQITKQHDIGIGIATVDWFNSNEINQFENPDNLLIFLISTMIK